MTLLQDTIDRSKFEEQLSPLLTSIFDRYRERAVELLGDSESFSRLGQGFYHDLVADLKEEIIPELVLIYMNAAAWQADQFGYVVDSGDLELEATKWANERGDFLAHSIAETTHEGLANIQHDSRNELEDTQDRSDYMLGAMIVYFAEDRAQKIAVTETTNAIEDGKEDIVDRIQDEYGITATGIWRCYGPNPCERNCAPLDGMPEEVWSREFPDGAPAHPWCCCEVEWSLDESLADE